MDRMQSNQQTACEALQSLALLSAAVILSLALVSSAVFLCLSLFPSAAPTAYEVLESYNFPKGILPKGVTHYDLDASTGKFNAYLNASCSFSLEGSYQLKYNSRISGYIYNETLTNLRGVSVKVLFLWLNMVEVRRKGKNLEFSLGIASAEFSMDKFYVCPQCGCGLDCEASDEDLKRGNLTRNPSVSSS